MPWWPDPYGIGAWPANAPREVTVDAFVRAFEVLGYQACGDGLLEIGYEKVAIFAVRDMGGSLTPTHAAKQLRDGSWSSKLGDFEDIEHPALDAVNGPTYGTAVRFVRRPV